MLTENNIVDFVSKYLEKDGCTITQALNTKQQGIDIVAEHPQKGYCFVEAKGATSSKKGSSRYGKEFNSSQIRTHMGVAILKSFQTLQLHPTSQVAIALPNNKGHRGIIDSMQLPIRNSGIRVYLVNEDGSVEVYI
ncbi:hypothetical protein [Desulfobacula sp.]|uniref:hypothetical protein n=1 Tax=Desulfobacula sp. TaxID=2593537 RepID=UPI001E10A8E2|nr:hypothetical protein [Desulfobacula sp.]MBT4968014.1 hypothetical protein [Bacteroidota bacterium]